MASLSDPAKILAIVLAGGEGKRLRPLTENHAKPSVVLGGYRLVDFVLSNLVNSGIDSIYLLAQYQPESLIEHIHANWTLAPNNDGSFVSVVVSRHEEGSYPHGTAAAVYQNLDLIERYAPDLVAVFGADQIYRMDVRQMVAYHRECNADATVAAIRVPKGRAAVLDILVTDGSGAIRDIQQGPSMSDPAGVRDTYASMGNYLFNPEVLVANLEQMARCGETDFGCHVLPRMVRNHRVYAYDFSGNTVPGIQPYEVSGYWRDIETLDDYVDAFEDISGSQPRFKLNNPRWPVSPPLTVQRPLFDAHYAQLLAERGRQPRRELSIDIVN